MLIQSFENKSNLAEWFEHRNHYSVVVTRHKDNKRTEYKLQKNDYVYDMLKVKGSVTALVNCAKDLIVNFSYISPTVTTDTKSESAITRDSVGVVESEGEAHCAANAPNALEGEPILPSDLGEPSSSGAVSSPTTSPTLYEPLFVETATTGLNPYDEICAICVLDANERVIYETLVKPSVPISRGATAYHDITNEMVANAPTYDKIHKRLKKIFGKSTLIFYNAEFDTQCIAQTASIAFDAEHHLTFRDCFPRNDFFCLMQGYAYLWGDYTYCDHEPAWQPLIRACEQQSIYLDDLPITDKSPIANAKRASRLFAKCFKSDLLF